jgi:transposase
VLDPKNLIYIDEAGIDDNESYPYGWSIQGSRCYSTKSGRRGERVSFIGALHNQRFIASLVFTGCCDSKIFETYVEHCLVPELKAGQIIIADNASFHKSKKAEELITKAGCILKFLPTYSPDFNPIEHYWFPIKNTIRKQLDHGALLYEASCEALKGMHESIC